MMINTRVTKIDYYIDEHTFFSDHFPHNIFGCNEFLFDQNTLLPFINKKSNINPLGEGSEKRKAFEFYKVNKEFGWGYVYKALAILNCHGCWRMLMCFCKDQYKISNIMVSQIPSMILLKNLLRILKDSTGSDDIKQCLEFWKNSNIWIEII